MFFVFQAKNDPFKKEGSKKEVEDKTSSNKSSEKRSSTGIKLTNKCVKEYVKEKKKFVIYIFIYKHI